MRFEYLVSIEVERESGKFAGRDEIGGKLQEELEGADPGSVDSDEDAAYDVTDWTVEEQEPTGAAARRPKAARGGVDERSVAQAMERYVLLGYIEAHRREDVPKGKVAGWAIKTGGGWGVIKAEDLAGFIHGATVVDLATHPISLG